MGLRFTLSFYGGTQLDRELARIQKAPDNMWPVWNYLTDRFVKMEKRQFKTEGQYGSGGWAPLSPRYGAWKAAAYPGKTILRRSDRLYDSLTRRPLPIEVLEASHMVIGSDVEYGKYHMRGAGRHMPRRRPIEFPLAERASWMKAIQRYIVTGKVGYGRGSGAV